MVVGPTEGPVCSTGHSSRTLCSLASLSSADGPWREVDPLLPLGVCCRRRYAATGRVVTAPGIAEGMLGVTLLFVHGTGVRAAGYTATLRVIEQGVKDHALPVAVRGCFWGEAEGARLNAGGASIPGYADTGGKVPRRADQLLAVWSMLYTDPWYELRLLRHMPRGGPASFRQEPSSVQLRRSVDDFTPSAILSEALRNADLAQRFDAAARGA
jgi:hypothetical protein